MFFKSNLLNSNVLIEIDIFCLILFRYSFDFKKFLILQTISTKILAKKYLACEAYVIKIFYLLKIPVPFESLQNL